MSNICPIGALTLVIALVGSVILPVVLYKFNVNHNLLKKANEQRFMIIQAENEVRRHQVILAIETAKAVRDGKANGNITEAIAALRAADNKLRTTLEDLSIKYK